MNATVIDNRGENYTHLVKRNGVIWESLCKVARRGRVGYHTGARVARGFSSAPYDYEPHTLENVKKLQREYVRLVKSGAVLTGVIVMNNYATELWVVDV